MKYIAVLLVGGAMYFYIATHPPARQALGDVGKVYATAYASGTSSQISPSRTDFLKRPIDQTREVIKKAGENVKYTNEQMEGN